MFVVVRCWLLPAGFVLVVCCWLCLVVRLPLRLFGCLCVCLIICLPCLFVVAYVSLVVGGRVRLLFAACLFGRFLVWLFACMFVCLVVCLGCVACLVLFVSVSCWLLLCVVDRCCLLVLACLFVFVCVFVRLRGCLCVWLVRSC